MTKALALEALRDGVTLSEFHYRVPANEKLKVPFGNKTISGRRKIQLHDSVAVGRFPLLKNIEASLRKVLVLGIDVIRQVVDVVVHATEPRGEHWELSFGDLGLEVTATRRVRDHLSQLTRFLCIAALDSNTLFGDGLETFHTYVEALDVDLLE